MWGWGGGNFFVLVSFRSLSCEAFPGNGRVEGVGEAVLKEAEEVGVTDGPLHGGDGLVDLGEGELAASWGWALVGELEAAFGEGFVFFICVRRVVWTRTGWISQDRLGRRGRVVG